MITNVSLAVAALVLTAGVITASVNARVQAVSRRADRLERKLDLIMAHLGVAEPEPAGLDRVRALLRDGKKIEAIKVYRGLTGEGLKEAKDAVEKLSH
ncbi:ribosomal protein L7/L12 [Streptomyces sp. NPDC101132]|uniref:ribosomal protein L7/L12 n=1 Tax=Streptomyces sp. NPDC101132 TaxID=3366110 RepID=UPI0037F846FA